MACELQRPDAQTLFNRHRNLFSSTVLGGGTVIPESNEWYAVSLNYAVAEDFYAIAEQAWRERDPRYACCDNLIAMAANEGVHPRPAVHAQGYVKLTGTAGTALPAPLEFTIGGLTYFTASDGTQPDTMPTEGTVVIRVRADTAGEAGNISETTGTMVTVVAGVNTDVEVCGGTFCNGSNAEECEAFRARFIGRKQYHPRANSAWALDKLLEWPCATRALVRAGSCCSCDNTQASGCNCVACGGDTVFYVMFDNAFAHGVAPQSVATEVQTWFFGNPQGYGLGQAPIGVCGRIVVPTCVLVNITVDVEDCISSAQEATISSQLAEYFSTLEPSKVLRSRALNTILASELGFEVNYEITVALNDNAQGYGSNGVPYSEGTTLVHVGNCDLEPECDVILCLNTVTFARRTESGTGCP